ncbi:unnamed protein product [Pleuronectes platessa]|uniref:Uncharacterized protein n=1 Tax=Pleuronectes platessa TaxID=8262 RepID=A0A9N7YWP8_PLEPL|nr:unnamed protein product [Pleuronectes platessa]
MTLTVNHKQCVHPLSSLIHLSFTVGSGLPLKTIYPSALEGKAANQQQIPVHGPQRPLVMTEMKHVNFYFDQKVKVTSGRLHSWDREVFWIKASIRSDARRSRRSASPLAPLGCNVVKKQADESPVDVSPHRSGLRHRVCVCYLQSEPGGAQRPGLTLAVVQLAASGGFQPARLTGGLNPPHRWALILLRRKETITLLCFGSALRSAPAERCEQKQSPPPPSDRWEAGGFLCTFPVDEVIRASGSGTVLSGCDLLLSAAQDGE